jgi:hypothetical protein
VTERQRSFPLVDDTACAYWDVAEVLNQRAGPAKNHCAAES